MDEIIKTPLFEPQPRQAKLGPELRKTHPPPPPLHRQCCKRGHRQLWPLAAVCTHGAGIRVFPEISLLFKCLQDRDVRFRGAGPSGELEKQTEAKPAIPTKRVSGEQQHACMRRPNKQVKIETRHSPGLNCSAAPECISLIAARRTCSQHRRVRSVLLNERNCSSMQTCLTRSGGTEQVWVTLGVTPSRYCAVSSFNDHEEHLYNTSQGCAHGFSNSHEPRGLGVTQRPDTQHPADGENLPFVSNPSSQH